MRQEFKQTFFAFSMHAPPQQQYLMFKSKLPQDARNRISGMVGQDDYSLERAVRILDQAYSNPELLLQRLTMKLESIVEEDTGRNDAKFADQVARIRTVIS